MEFFVSRNIHFFAFNYSFNFHPKEALIAFQSVFFSKFLIFAVFPIGCDIPIGGIRRDFSLSPSPIGKRPASIRRHPRGPTAHRTPSAASEKR